MTVPGLIDKADDKEKLVVKTDVATIMPKRDRLIKIKKRRHILRIVISLALLFLFLSTIFLTICYIKKIGPFKRIFRAICPVGEDRYGRHKVYESLEVTDDYALINVPKFHIKFGTFQSVKTLHVFKKQVTVIQYNGMCFVRPMLRNQRLDKNWYDKVGQYTPGRAPSQYTHFHWRLTHRPYSPNYLEKHVHNLAAAMCMSRPVFHLKFYFNHQSFDNSCTKRCLDCPVSRQNFQIEMVNGVHCKVCHCKPIENLKSSNRVDQNCKSIRCENKCFGKKMVGCVHCVCDDHVTRRDTENVKDPMIFQDNSRVYPKHLEQNDATPAAPIEFQDLSKQQRIYDVVNRKKRSTSGNCKIVAEIFEGYNPLSDGGKPPVDYIHDC